MAARSKRLGRAAVWAISLGLHLLFLALVLLAPVRRIANPSMVEVSLAPPPEGYSPLQSAPSPSTRPSLGAPPVRIAHSPIEPEPGPVQSIPVAPTPSVAQATASAAPSPAQPAAASASVAQATAAAPGQASSSSAKGIDAAAVDMLRQTFGCSSGMRSSLTSAEKAACEQRAAVRAKDIPDRPGDTIPKYKRDYYDEVIAVRNSPSHIPGTNCKYVGKPDDAPAPKGGAPVSGGVTFRTYCVPPLGAGPKPPPYPSLQDLGLAR